jgi:hypothetical protein
MAKKPASIKDCAKSLAFLPHLKDGGYINDEDHDRIVGRIRRDLAKHGGVKGLEREGRRKRMAGGYGPNLLVGAPPQGTSTPFARMPQPTRLGVSKPMGYSGGYDGKQPDNEPYGWHDEENLNWHQRAGYHGMQPLGGYDIKATWPRRYPIAIE